MLHRLLLPFTLLAALLFPHDPLTRTVNKAQGSLLRVTGIETMNVWGMDVQVPYVCSGFIVAPGLALTAKHCVGESMSVDGSLDVVVLKVSDDVTDLALLRTSSRKHALPLSDAPLQFGDHLVGVGYGFGWDRPTISPVIVMIPNYSPNPELAAGIFTIGGYHGGMSGGPVLNMDGEVVGIVQRTGDGVGYGVGTLLIRGFLLGV